MSRSLQQLREERAIVAAQLHAAQEQAAWLEASDDPEQLAEGRIWRRQADALQVALDDADVELLKAELDAW